jgi:hypothetical protein
MRRFFVRISVGPFSYLTEVLRGFPQSRYAVIKVVHLLVYDRFFPNPSLFYSMPYSIVKYITHNTWKIIIFHSNLINSVSLTFILSLSYDLLPNGFLSSIFRNKIVCMSYLFHLCYFLISSRLSEYIICSEKLVFSTDFVMLQFTPSFC